jgi:hypothetical protein
MACYSFMRREGVFGCPSSVKTGHSAVECLESLSDACDYTLVRRKVKNNLGGF